MNCTRIRTFARAANDTRRWVAATIDRHRWILSLFLAQALLLSGPFARSADLPKPMSRVVTPGYEIYSSVSERRTRDVLNELSAYHQLMEASMKRKALPEAVPTRILLLSRADWRRYFGVRKDLVGLFVPHTFANYLLIDAGSSRDAYMPTVFHEYTHYFLHTQFPGDYPAWFDEGLAEVMSTAKFRGDEAIVEPSLGHAYQIQSSSWMPTSTMLRVDRGSPEYTQHRLAASFYAQSWLFMHYALIQDFEFGGSVFRYVGALNRPGTTIDAAAIEAFGDEKHLDELLRKYSRRDAFISGKLPIGKLPEPTLVTPSAMTDVDTGFAIADAAVAIGLASPETIALVDAVIAAAPAERKGFAYALRAQAAMLASDEAGTSRHLALATESLSASDTDGHKAIARLLFMRSSSMPDTNQSSATVQQARSLYETARRLDAKDLEACWGYGLTSMTARVEMNAAKELLATCVERAPRHAELNYAVAIAYSESGELQRMRDHLVYAIRYSRDSQMRAQMRETLRNVDSRLRAEGRLKE